MMEKKLEFLPTVRAKKMFEEKIAVCVNRNVIETDEDVSFVAF